ncbi:MAG: VWA domain-containing protein, partial [Myxococcales bacterium]
GSAAGSAGSSGGSGQGGAAACGAGRADCDGQAANGCEASTATDASNCGACGTVCPVSDQATATCVDGQCVVVCAAGHANCDGVVENGCEVSTTNDVFHCGYCGHTCADGPGNPAACVNGVCTVACQGTLSDCNLTASDGCEVDTTSDPLNCGSCGNVCGGSAQCVQSACECAGTSAAAVPVQLSMYVMLDKSGSMLDPVEGAGTRWEAVKSALNQFFASPEAAGIEVALNFFPLQAPGGPACGEAYYYTPAVAMSSLPGPGGAQSAALSAAMAATTPSGGTPTQAALGAALHYASDWKTAFPKDKTIVVLATDGQPGDGCGATVENSSAAAATGFQGSPSVPTYVIGVGSNLTALDAVAQAGGTGTAFLVNDGNTGAFLQALQQIKLQAVACEFALPAPATGTLDYDKVNVQYTPGGTTTAQYFTNAADAASCGAQTSAWYYDSASAPTKILLCPATCSLVQADPSAKVSIQLGCDTIKE